MPADKDLTAPPLRAARALLAGSAALALAVLPATSAGAATGDGEYGHWEVTGRGQGVVHMDQVSGFPEGRFTTDSTSHPVQSGNSAFLGASTPVGAKYGSSQGKPYVNLRTATGGRTSTTTLSYAHSPVPGTWALTLGDVDADRVHVSGVGADGSPLTAAQLGFKGAFNYCQNSPKPSTCAGSGPFTDMPVWDPATATLSGNGLDTLGASGWFEPTVEIRSITLRFSVQTGIPIYQLWTSTLDQKISGKVSSDCGVPVGDKVTLLHDGKQVLDGRGNPATTTVGADGTYSFKDVAPGTYDVKVGPAEGYTPSVVTKPVDATDAQDKTNVNVALTCTVIEDPVPEDVDTGVDEPVVIPVPPGPGPTQDSRPRTIRWPEHGTVTVVPGKNQLIYTPDEGYVGPDSFTYSSLNKRGQTVVKTVELHIKRSLANSGSPGTYALAGFSVLLVGAGVFAMRFAGGRRRRS
ncbi:Ig-like domain-containing protein [Streptomyces sp. NPDC050085]|uniref:Ig-like domain-containing protein n=1 Tax=Streptomyces sp. NPDC050085 TaxID=3365600 RepID=UPI0037A484C3